MTVVFTVDIAFHCKHCNGKNHFGLRLITTFGRLLNIIIKLFFSK